MSQPSPAQPTPEPPPLPRSAPLNVARNPRASRSGSAAQAPPAVSSATDAPSSSILQQRAAGNRRARRARPPGWAIAFVGFARRTKDFLARTLPGSLVQRKRELGTVGLSLLVHLVILLLFSMWLLPAGTADDMLRLFSATPEEPELRLLHGADMISNQRNNIKFLQLLRGLQFTTCPYTRDSQLQIPFLDLKTIMKARLC